MKTIVNKIPQYISHDLNSNHVNRLFELTELQLKWFNMYYPSLNVPFHKLLRRNHRKILTFMKIDLMGDYIIEEIDNKFNRMFKAYYSLFEISKEERKIRKLELHG